MVGQVLRHLRARPALEVGRRADNGHAHIRTDAHGDHVLGHLLAQAHACVVALRDDVGQAIVDDDLDMDVRIGPQQLRYGGPQDRLRGVLAGRDANGPGRLLAQLAQGGERRIDIVKARTDGLKQALAGLCRSDAARRAREQPDAMPLFQSAHRVTERRGRNAKLRRRLGEAALARHGNKGRQVVEVFPGHL